MERLKTDEIAHNLFLGGMSAYRAPLLEFAERINEIQEAGEELQGLVSGEMMAGLVKPDELREVVEELGHGWRIERQPTAPNARAATSTPPAATTATPPIGDWVSDGSIGTPGYSWLSDDWVTQLAAAVDDNDGERS